MKCFYPIKGCVGGVLSRVFELRTPALWVEGVRSWDTRGNVRSNSGSGVIYASYGLGADSHLRLSLSQQTPSPKRPVPKLLAVSGARCGA